MHVWIILDGNRRRAKQRNLPSIQGHLAGAERLESTIKYGFEKGIDIITVYGFSTENRNRDPSEVEGLMKIFLDYLSAMIPRLENQEIKVNILGDKSAFSPDLQHIMQQLEDSTAKKSWHIFNLCLNYGGRAELLQAMQRLANEVQKGNLQPTDINETLISNYLYTKGQPDPDLIIRTSGENRLSGFLTWQSTYAELIFTKTLRPDFSEEVFDECLTEYEKRHRRFGK